jgi:hypothetical protein
LSATLFQSAKTRRLPAAERDAAILRLRGLGQPLEAIAQKVGTSERTVRRVVSRRLDELTVAIQQDTQRIRAQHLLEIEQLRGRLAPVLAAADHSHRIGAVRTWLQLLERESKLLGLDQPMRLEMAAQSAAAEALLQRLADALPPEVMNQIVGALTDGI